MTRRDRIEALIADYLNPLLAVDGGEVELVSVDGPTVKLRIGGALQGCPGTAYVKRGVILPAMRSVVGSRVKVEFVPALLDA